MKYEIEAQKLDMFFESVKELETLLTERIADMHEVKGLIQARHVYIYYRKLLSESKDIIRNNVNKI